MQPGFLFGAGHYIHGIEVDLVNSTVMPSPADEDTLVVALAAYYRHAMMNHLQVVAGWLQLGQPERAEEYIGQLKESLQDETKLARAAEPRVAAVFILRRGLAEACGIDLTFKVTGRLDGFGWRNEEMGLLVGGLIDASILILDRSQMGRLLEVGIAGEDDHWEVTLSLLQAAVAEDDFRAELQRTWADRHHSQGLDRVLENFVGKGGRLRFGHEGDTARLRLSWPRTVSM